MHEVVRLRDTRRLVVCRNPALVDCPIPRCRRVLLAMVLGLAGTGVMAEPAANAVVIHTRSDRTTLKLAKAPQVYIAGTFNADAVRQVGQLLASGKVSAGTDVYLDARGDDIASGMVLGKMFRDAKVNTHVGAWRTGRLGLPASPATCVDACAYAYLGGVYRWTPGGRDRIGMQAKWLPGDSDAATDGMPSPKARGAYVEAMDVPLEWLAHALSAPDDGMVWWQPDAMGAWLVANNGRQALEARYDAAPKAPRLVLTQTVKGGRNEITLRCAANQLALTAHYTVGYQQATHVAGRAMYAYFEIDRHAVEKRQGELPTVDGNALVFTRDLPMADLASVLHTLSLGAWVEVTGSPVRLGFQLAPAVVAPLTRPFQTDCEALQPGYKPPAKPDEPTKPSFWDRLFGRLS